jgi:hypothetical protein
VLLALKCFDISQQKNTQSNVLTWINIEWEKGFVILACFVHFFVSKSVIKNITPDISHESKHHVILACFNRQTRQINTNKTVKSRLWCTGALCCCRL